MKNDNQGIEKLLKSENNDFDLLSFDEVRAIIDNPKLKIKGLNKYVKFKQGVIPMYVILSAVTIFAALTTFTYNFLNNITSNEKNANSSLNKTIEYTQNKVNAEKSNDNNTNYQVPNENQSSQNINNSSNEELINKINVPQNVFDMKKVDINGINCLELNEDELKNLGVYIDDNQGNLSYWDNWDVPNAKPFILTLKPEGGVIKNYDHKEFKNPKFSPRLITDINGLKRVAVMFDSINKSMIYRTYENAISYDNNLTKSKLIEYYDKNEKNFNYSNGSKVEIVNVENKNNKLTLPIDTIINFNITKWLNDNNLKMLNIDSLKINLDSFQIEIPEMPDWDINEFYSDNQNNANKFNFRLFKNKNLDIKELLKLGIDTTILTTNQFNPKNNKTNIKIRNISSIKFENDTSKNIKEFIINDSNIHKMVFLSKEPISFNIKKIENSLELNKLIPVKVNTKKNINYILWYEPSKEMIANLPEKYRIKLKTEIEALKKNEICNSNINAEESLMEIWKSCSGAIENLRIYPNPAKDNINLSYTLNAERTISISIYNLQGNKIYDIAQNLSRKSGSFDENYQLKNLPAGIYLITIKTNHQEKALQRIVVE